MIRGGHWWIYITTSGVNWAQVISGDSLPVKKGSCNDLLSVPAPEDANVIICLQGERIRTFQVDLPRKNKRKFLSSIAYVLEDKLIHSPEEYHFIPIIQEQNSNRIAVAVIEKNDLDVVVSWAKEKKWQISLITADYMYVANPERKQWILDATSSPLILRGVYPELGSVLSGEISANLHPALRLALEKSDNRPEKLLIRVKDNEQSEVINSWSEGLNELGVKVEKIVDTRSRVDWLSRFPVPEIEFNFLTGPFKGSSNRQSSLSRLIPVAGMTLLILILLLIQFFMRNNRIETEYNYLRTEQEATYRELFPQSKNIVDPKYQMEQALLQLQSSSTAQEEIPTDFLSQLEVLSRHIDPVTSYIDRIEYDGSKIILDLNIDDYELLEDLQRRLSSDIKVSVQSAELKGEKVQSRIFLEKKI
jgi:general secretion pathway protein L